MARHFFNRHAHADPRKAVFGIIEKMIGGDVLFFQDVTDIAHSYRDLKEIFRILESKAAAWKTYRPRGGRNTDIMERFKAAIRRDCAARAKARGAYANNPGRPRSVDSDAIRKLASEGLTKKQIVEHGYKRASVYRALAA
jgi:hypothetical protein